MIKEINAIFMFFCFIDENVICVPRDTFFYIWKAMLFYKAGACLSSKLYDSIKLRSD